MTFRRSGALIGATVLVLVAATLSAPFLRAAGLVARVAHVGGRLEALAHTASTSVSISASAIPTRHGTIPAQVYEPADGARRTTLLIPGIHSMGVHEPRLIDLAMELAATGVRVVTAAPPDLMTYTITPRATDVIEDAVTWLAAHTAWSSDGRVGIIGVSFAGGLSIVAAGRDAIRDKVSFVVSFGGHGDLPRVMHYLATGDAPEVGGVRTVRPHDYGLAVLLYTVAPTGIVPPEQAGRLREAVSTYLLASQLTLVDMPSANAAFAKARDMAGALPAPASSYMTYVNNRDVDRLGSAIAPFLDRIGGESDLSPLRTTGGLPTAPIYLLHGDEDSVIPTAESVLLGNVLRRSGCDVRVLVSPLITHAELNRSADVGAAWELVAFWSEVLKN